jgi:hypothetical protein
MPATASATMTAMRFNAAALILTSRMDIGATIGVARHVAQAACRVCRA